MLSKQTYSDEDDEENENSSRSDINPFPSSDFKMFNPELMMDKPPSYSEHFGYKKQKNEPENNQESEEKKENVICAMEIKNNLEKIDNHVSVIQVPAVSIRCASLEDTKIILKDINNDCPASISEV